MIKFKCLIHKETGTVIKYEEWLTHLRGNKEIKIEKKIIDNNFYMGVFDPIDIALFSDDFEIIYNTEFTVDELYSLYGQSGELRGKIERMVVDKKKMCHQYNIDL